MEGTQVIQCGSACTVTLQVEPSPASQERLADYGDLFLLFLTTLVVVFCAKGLVNLFWKDNGSARD